MQFIDVRDLAEFMVHLLEDGRGRRVQRRGAPSRDDHAGIPRPGPLCDLLGSDAKFTYVDDYDLLAKHKIEEAIPWAMLKGNDLGMMSIRHERAQAAGLTYRPLAATVRDTLDWWSTVP